ncbi:Dxo1p [Maudiozyma exigua]|uniref:Decapping nuclease n=1 Tax=Maudiozyma exigua TaxID=34358 RepID=A0A9P7B8V3_MAUEX|nr:Dxo1p [Kazachstania exigua]
MAEVEEYDPDTTSENYIDHITTNLNKLKLKKKTGNTKRKYRGRKSGTKCKTNTVIPFYTFNHSNKLYLPNNPKELFISKEEVGLYKNGTFTDDNSKQSKSKTMPILKQNIALLYDKPITECRPLKNDFIGADLYENLEKYNAMDDKTLDSIEPCMKYIETQNVPTNNTDEKIVTIVSARHHIVEIGMSLFNSNERDKDVTFIVTYLDCGLLLFSQDALNKSFQKGGIYSNDPIFKKICFSGFAFEDLITSEDVKEPAFSIVKAKLNDEINLVLRCEMDAYNLEKNIYSELKCYADLKMKSPQHRKKLLKTWLQTALCPESDIIIGIRNPTDGILHDILQYTRTTLYRKFNNRNLTPFNKDFNYNANIAVEWTQHCLKSVSRLVKLNIDRGIKVPQSFKIKIDSLHNISIRKLQSTPHGVEIPNL